jgi:HEAT repeat protein
MQSVFRVLFSACLAGVILQGGPAQAQATLDAVQAVQASDGETAFRAALERLKSTSATERAAAADEMGRRGYRLRHEIAEALRPLLHGDPEPLVRAAAGRAVGRLGVREALPELVQALDDPSPDVRVVAAAALWRLPDPQAVEPLLRHTADSDGAVREWAAQALGVIGDPRALVEMVRLLSDPLRAVRVAAVLSLGRLGDPLALAPLRKYLIDGPRDDEEKEEVVHAIANNKSPEKVEVLFQLLADSAADAPQTMRVLAALGQVADASVVARIKVYTRPERPPLVRKVAKEALAAIAGRSSDAKLAEGSARP